MSIKTITGTCNAIISKEAELADYAVMLQKEDGFNSAVYALSNEYGVFAVVVADNEQDALDNAVDQNKCNCIAMSEKDHAEYEENGWDDSYILAGNASEPFWSEHLSITQIISQA